MKYSNSSRLKDKKKQNSKNSYSRNFAHKYDEVDRLTEAVYTR